MNFSWDVWIVIFIGFPKYIPYIWDIEFYDTGLTEVLLHET